MRISNLFNSKIILPALAIILVAVIVLMPLFTENDQVQIDEADKQALTKFDVLVATPDVIGLPHADEEVAVHTVVPDSIGKKEKIGSHKSESHAVDQSSNTKHEAADSHSEQTAIITEPVESDQHLSEHHELPAGPVCYEVGPVINAAKKTELENFFHALDVDIRSTSRSVEKDAGYWVYLPPRRSVAIGRLLVEEIKLKGLDDVGLLIRHEPKLAISFGVFKQKNNAHRRLLKAQSLGFDARMEKRRVAEDQVWLLLTSQAGDVLSEQERSNFLQQHAPIELKTIICS